MNYSPSIRSYYNNNNIAIQFKPLNDTLERYRVYLVVQQETRWPAEGNMTGNISLMYGRITNKNHKNEVGFLVPKKLLTWIKKFREVNTW